MDNAKEGGYVNHIRIMYGTTYNYWKACIISFLKSMDNKTWKSVINTQTSLKVTTEDNTKTLNPENNWSKEEDKEALGNSHALNSM